MVKEDAPKIEMSDLKPSETRRIMKNVVVISLAFMAHFTAFNGTVNLQSSINAEAGVGTSSLAAVYSGLIISNIFLPPLVIKWLGTKWAMCLSFLTYMPYIAVQLKPNFYTMIPAGFIVGLGGGPLWCAKSTYLTVVSEAHSYFSKISSQVLLTRFMGLFFMMIQSSEIWGNLISSLVLSSADNAAAVTSVNVSLIPELCGANFLPFADAEKALPQQPPEKIQKIVGLYLACIAGAAITVAVGVDSMIRYDSARKTEDASSGMALSIVTLKLLVEPNQLLLVIITVFSGFQEAFFGADFTAAFVSCAIGTGSVGFVVMTFGLANAIACVVTGYLAKVTGRPPLVCAATVIHTALCVTMLTWKPQAGFGYVLYIIAVLWGLCDSIWIVQITAYCGIIFRGREEAAFSNFYLWYSVGFIIAYGISPRLRTSSKIYLMIIMMVVGVIGYFVVEVRDRRAKKLLETQKDKEEPSDVRGCDNKAFQNIE